MIGLKINGGLTGLWSTLRNLWRAEYGLPFDEHVRADAGLPSWGPGFTCYPVSPFAGAWLR
ncbi:hypothetical protein [Muricoccus vinaceus]|uniref:Uncharacterized protein n=1 Tax=Muricoccus vinaceus TaxID=424704 RepID=A0ABV6J0V5_9PROT